MIPTLLPAGDRAVLFELGSTIDADTNARIIALAARLEAVQWAGVTEIVPTYRSLLVCYDPMALRGAELETRLLALWQGLTATAAPAGRLWRVPCLYGGEVGQDLETLASLKGLTPDEVIALHSGAEYRVYMIGFAPGFAYLGGLPERLHTPRLPVPRQSIPAGAIGIGGQQGSISSVAGPSGWRFVGWTPWNIFDAAAANPVLLRAGDRVRFEAVTPTQAQAIAEGLANRTIHPEPQTTGADDA
jgi:KipI family sensor histidine kinase inhibitor